ncbi:MAG: hypothetical protein ACFFCI_00755 [Promethearchaeota archaeon]
MPEHYSKNPIIRLLIKVITFLNIKPFSIMFSTNNNQIWADSFVIVREKSKFKDKD